jgi:prepilin-type N-terminal cleavage/methylation domain-containing protein
MKKGFTLIELLFVFGIILILTGIVFYSLSTFNKSQMLDRDTEKVVEVLRQARSQTLSAKNATNYGVYLASTTITLFTGNTYATTSSDNNQYPLLTSDLISTITLTGGGSQIVFNRLTGETAQNGTIVLTSPSLSRTRTITIYKTGVIQWQ